MSPLRFGIVGYGNIGRTHAQTLSAGAVARANLTAVATQSDDELPAGVARFAEVDAMLAADVVDAVIVATPTFSHGAMGAKVLAANKHLVMEKPVGMSVGEAQALVDQVPDGVVAAVMLNQRHHPAYQAMQAAVAGGELGRLVRFSWIMTEWYRPDI